LSPFSLFGSLRHDPPLPPPPFSVGSASCAPCFFPPLTFVPPTPFSVPGLFLVWLFGQRSPFSFSVHPLSFLSFPYFWLYVPFCPIPSDLLRFCLFLFLSVLPAFASYLRHLFLLPFSIFYFMPRSYPVVLMNPPCRLFALCPFFRYSV